MNTEKFQYIERVSEVKPGSLLTALGKFASKVIPPVAVAVELFAIGRMAINNITGGGEKIKK